MIIKNKFHTFINFSAVGDRENRTRLASAVYDGLRRNASFSIPRAGNFNAALTRMAAYEPLRELCAKDSELAEHITRSILEFIDKTQSVLDKIESPYAMEQRLLQEFKSLAPEDFEIVWEGVKPFLQETYATDVLDTLFYTRAFRASLSPQKRKCRKKISFEGVKEQFIERWNELLIQKQNDWEEAYIEDQSEVFSEHLRQRIEEIIAARELFDSPLETPARLWNLQKTQKQRTDFVLLNKYADLVRRDPLLRELAENLGRAWASEAEEGFWENKKAVSEPPPVCFDKTDITGVQESGDLNSLLPSEAVLLADEKTQFLFYKKFAEKKLLTFAYQSPDYRSWNSGTKRGPGRKETSQGPFILCVDTSGSMRGEPETLAKTVCFGLAKTAFQERRGCYLISFGACIETLNLTNAVGSLDTLCDFLSCSFYGGTNPLPVFQEALTVLETAAYRNADVVMVSDFIMPPPDEQTLFRVKAAKENKTRFHALLVGDPERTGISHAALEYFDDYWIYENWR